MSDVSDKPNEKVTEAAPAAEGAVTAKKLELAKILGVLKRHPLGLVALVGAAAALVEVELAVGLLTGIGATALLATKNGADVRHDVVSKSKAAIERARAALASRSKPSDAPATAAPAEQPPTQPPASAA